MKWELTKLTEADFEAIWKIMEESFPADERRTKEGQKMLFEEPNYHVYGYLLQKDIVAILAVWEFDTFTFLEHFAVSSSYRNGGIGAEVLQQMLTQMNAPVVLEVELPTGNLTERRIGFYERNGFVLNHYEYVQPALNAASKPIPLMIMSNPKKLKVNEFENIRDILYHYVYKV